jgi:hypothetical protein
MSPSQDQSRPSEQSLDVGSPRHDDRNPVISPLVGETFHFDLDGAVIAGRFIEVDPPHRMQFSGLHAEAAALYAQLWERHLDRIAAAFSGVESAHGS